MAEVITVGEKGQIVIPKQMRDDFKLDRGAKLLIVEEDGRITMKPVQLNETQMLMLMSESSLKKTWDNKYDERWDNAF